MVMMVYMVNCINELTTVDDHEIVGLSKERHEDKRINVYHIY